MSDINAVPTPEDIAIGKEAKRIIEGEAMQTVFKSLEDAYISAWRKSDVNADGSPAPLDEQGARRGTLWVKLKCLEDLQFELRAYANRSEFAEVEAIN